MLLFLVEVVHNVQVGPWLLALFIFVVCGSAIFQIIQSIRMAWKSPDHKISNNFNLQSIYADFSPHFLKKVRKSKW